MTDKKIAIAPQSWAGYLGMLLTIYEDGNATGREQAGSELRRMAAAADIATTANEKNTELRGALGNLLQQVEQMQDMFDDTDGTIQAAIDDAEAAIEAANA